MRRASSLLSSLSLGVVLLLAAPQHSSVFAASSFGPSCVQSTATLIGKVVDQNDAVVAGAKVTALKIATNLERITTTDDRGTYQIAALPVGYYRLEINAAGFRTKIVEGLEAEVAKVIAQNFQLEVGDVSQTVQVPADTASIELANTSVGQVINERTVQEIPLNGRYFIDLGLLIPGSVTPPQNGFMSPPTRDSSGGGASTKVDCRQTVYFVTGDQLFGNYISGGSSV